MPPDSAKKKSYDPEIYKKNKEKITKARRKYESKPAAKEKKMETQRRRRAARTKEKIAKDLEWKRANRAQKVAAQTEEEKENVRVHDRERWPERWERVKEREAQDQRLKDARIAKQRVKEARRKVRRGLRDMAPYSRALERVEVHGDVYIQTYSCDSGRYPPSVEYGKDWSGQARIAKQELRSHAIASNWADEFLAGGSGRVKAWNETHMYARSAQFPNIDTDFSIKSFFDQVKAEDTILLFHRGFDASTVTIEVWEGFANKMRRRGVTVICISL